MLGTVQGVVVHVPPPNPVVSGGDVASVANYKFALPVGAVPWTQNDMPW